MAAVITVPVVYQNTTKVSKNVYLPTASITFEAFTPTNKMGGAASDYPFDAATASTILSVVTVVNAVNPIGLTYYSTASVSTLLTAANA